MITLSFQYASFDYMLYFAGRLCDSSSTDSIFPYGGFLLDVNGGNLSYLFVVKVYNVSSKMKICHGISWGRCKGINLHFNLSRFGQRRR